MTTLIFEQTWICEPNDRVFYQSFGVKNMHVYNVI